MDIAVEITVYDAKYGECLVNYESHPRKGWDLTCRDCEWSGQHDWHCMAYAIFLLQQYHNGDL